MSSSPRALLVTPELPARSGNGLAMRAGVTLQALAELARVTVVVVRAPGDVEPPGPTRAWVEARAEHVVVHRVAPPDDRAVAASWLADPEARDRLAALEPLAESGRLAHPAAVAALWVELAELGGVGGVGGGAAPAFEVVVAERLRTAPWVEPALGQARLTLLDLDDDEVVTHQRLARAARWRGEPELADDLEAEGAALGRLSRWYLPRFDLVTVASADDPQRLGSHGSERAGWWPNAVELADPQRAPGPGPGWPRRRRSGVGLLLVGNLSYAPNRWAATDLVRHVQPALAERRGEPVEVTLVGAAPASVLALAHRAGVTVTGPVDSLDEAYAAADLVVLPLVPAGGTRLKVLEAFARQVPVVATAAAVEGLGIEPGVHALVVPDAEPLDVDGLVTACSAALDDPMATAARVAAARALVADRFTVAGVVRQWSDRLRARLAEGDAGGPPGAR